jgi:hypothetical protein
MDAANIIELRAVIGLLIYGGVFESSYEHIQSLYKMDGTGGLVFPVVMAKNCFRFLLCHVSQRRTNQLSFSHHSIMIQQSAAIQESLNSLNFITKQKVQ